MDYIVDDLNDSTSPIEKFAKKVFEQLISEGIPPVPSNYSLYFFNMLENESEEFKKQVYEILSLEETRDIESDLEVEKKFKHSFKATKELLQHTALIYKLSNQLKKVLDDVNSQITHASSPKTIEKILEIFKAKIQRVTEKMDEELKIIKEGYSKNIEIIKEIESNSIFDMTYGVYNEKYFVRTLEKEIKLVQKFKHTSSVVFLKVDNKIFKSLSSQKSILMVNRSIAKILLKTSRRTDIVAHMKNGIFAMLLKHTDRIGAQKTVERLSDIIANSAIFIEGNETELKIVSSVCEVTEEVKLKILLNKCENLVHKAQMNNKLYIVDEG